MKKFIFTLFFLIILTVSANASILSDGEYVSFGTYNGQEILWKIIKTDNGDITVLSDKVLCLKEFDVQNCDWENSSLRAWLNSETATPDATYAESGFLSNENFSDGERSMLKSYQHESILNTSSDPSLEQHEYVGTWYGELALCPFRTAQIIQQPLNKTMTVIFDGEVLCFEEPLANTDFDNITYGNFVATYRTESTPNRLHLMAAE